jgi:FtsZ-binding cell division protein ZapB
VNVDISLGNAIEIVSILGMGTALLLRGAGLIFEVKELRKEVNELKPHGVSVPLLQQRVDQIETEGEHQRKRTHDMANTLQWVMGRLEEIAPREPSRPDLTVERDPRRR